MANPHPSPAAVAGGSNPLRTAALILLGLATLVSAWLAYQSLQSGPVPGCDSGECGIVLSSKWAKVFGVPVGIFGSAAYLTLALLAFRPFTARQQGPRLAAAVLVLLIPAAGLWFAGLQIFVLKAFCKWCSATHVVATVGAILMALAWRRETHPGQTPTPAAPPSPSKKPSRSKTTPAAKASVWGTALGCAALAFGGFAILQALSPEPPKRRIVSASMETASPTNTPAANTPSAANTASTATNAAPVPASTNAVAATAVPPPTAPRASDGPISLHGGKFILHPEDLPHYGSPKAPYRFVMISDYTCVHCRHANRILSTVRETFRPDELCVTMLPTHHGGESLEIQQAMLAAWKLDPKVWSDVATEIYFDRLPYKIDNIRTVLETKLGADRLAESLRVNEAWTTNLANTTKQILVANREKTKSGSIPQFIIGSEIIVGSPDDDSEFYQLFEKNLGLVRDRFPELALASTNIQVGRLFAGTSRTVSLALTNTGASSLQISRATVPAGGRVLRGLQVPVAPGQTSVLEVAVAAPREAGPFEHQLILFSNSKTSEARVRISGTVWRPIQISPNSVDFGRLDPDNTITQGVLHIELEEPARLASVRSQNPGFTAKLREIIPGKSYDIEVATTESLAPGNQQSTLLVSLEKPVPDGWPESLAFAARAIVDRAVTVVPQRFSVPATTLTTERHLQALVRCTDNTADFKVISAVLEGGPSVVQPQVQSSSGTGGTIVRFTLPAGWTLPPPPAVSRLIIQTTHPKIPTLEVPFVSQ